MSTETIEHLNDTLPILERRSNFATWLAKNGIAAAVFEYNERNRDPSVRYFTDYPADAICVITVTGECIISPWDINLAKTYAVADKIVPFTKFERSSLKAALGLIKMLKIPANSKIEISPLTPYPNFLQYVDFLVGYDVRCHNEGSHAYVKTMRATKDSRELEFIKKACAITNSLIDKIEEGVKNESLKTETDVALLIEKECRKEGCERTGFDTLVAGPERSFGIHCFPSYTNKGFAEKGLSILDFGLVYNGYTSDVTITIAKGELTPAQEKILSLVQKAYNESLELYAPGVSIKAAAMKTNEVFSKAKKTMPHALGHGIGLEAHEEPTIRGNTTPDALFQPGMVVTLEPGLYDIATGGCRLENDILITTTGHEVLTNSRIIRL